MSYFTGPIVLFCEFFCIIFKLGILILLPLDGFTEFDCCFLLSGKPCKYTYYKFKEKAYIF